MYSYAEGYSSLSFVRPLLHQSEVAELKVSPALNALGRDFVVLKEADGAAPLAALMTFDPCKCNIASPLAFFGYRSGGNEYHLAAMQPLRRRVDASTWNEYLFAKPMTLEPGGVFIVPIDLVYDRLRPLCHFLPNLKVCTKTVHLATFM
jgi:hypothetical protein